MTRTTYEIEEHITNLLKIAGWIFIDKPITEYDAYINLIFADYEWKTFLLFEIGDGAHRRPFGQFLFIVNKFKELVGDKLRPFYVYTNEHTSEDIIKGGKEEGLNMVFYDEHTIYDDILSALPTDAKIDMELNYIQNQIGMVDATISGDPKHRANPNVRKRMFEHMAQKIADYVIIQDYKKAKNLFDEFITMAKKFDESIGLIPPS